MFDAECCFQCSGSKCHGHTMIFVSSNADLSFRVTLFAGPGHFAFGRFEQYKSQFFKFSDKRSHTVGFLYFKALYALKMKRNVQHATSHSKCLSQIRLVDEIIFKFCAVLSGAAKLYAFGLVACVYAQLLKKICHFAVALRAVGFQSFQENFTFTCQRKRFVPIRCTRPIRFYFIFYRFISLRTNINSVVFKSNFYSVFSHYLHGHTNIRHRNHIAYKFDCQSVDHVWRYHHQSRDVLTAHTTIQRYVATHKRTAENFQWWKTFFFNIFNAGT